MGPLQLFMENRHDIQSNQMIQIDIWRRILGKKTLQRENNAAGQDVQG